jgi:hypothetical protein
MVKGGQGQGGGQQCIFPVAFVKQKDHRAPWIALDLGPLGGADQARGGDFLCLKGRMSLTSGEKASIRAPNCVPNRARA